jgi:hypothetical protein
MTQRKGEVTKRQIDRDYRAKSLFRSRLVVLALDRWRCIHGATAAD